MIISYKLYFNKSNFVLSDFGPSLTNGVFTGHRHIVLDLEILVSNKFLLLHYFIVDCVFRFVGSLVHYLLRF